MRMFTCLLLALLLFPGSLPAPVSREPFGKEHLTGTLVGPGRTEESACIKCHLSDIMKPEWRNIPDEWSASWHAQNNVSCHDCHGGDPKDAAMGMSPERGFVGTPPYGKVPEFCGKCHIGILRHFEESNHGRALRVSGAGPNCVTCHGSHDIRKADIEIISEQRCSRCHSYERAQVMKQALSVAEKKIRELEDGIQRLTDDGVYTKEEGKTLFGIQAEFRTLFHSVDVDLIKARTDEFLVKLKPIDATIGRLFRELEFRRNFSIFLMLLFLGMGVVISLIAKARKK